jgi:dTMP kinase
MSDSGRPGRFITIEGGEGAGKSTQIARLVSRLEAAGRTVLRTREPGGSPGAEAIRNLVVTGAGDRWDGVTEALLMFAARRDHMRATVWPALERGDWVVSDRFADSSMAYQGHARGLGPDKIAALYAWTLGDFRPDLTLILDLPVEIGLGRARARAGAEQRFEGLDVDFHRRIAAGFHAIAAAEPQRCRLIDGSGTIDRTAGLLWAAVADRFDLPR